MNHEAAALAYLRNPARNTDEILAALNAMCSGQAGIVAEHLSVCASRIEEDTPDAWEPELPEPRTLGRDDGAVPMWMTKTGVMA
jgi:hypothetical protein